MDLPRSAEIIPFPTRAAETPAERLRRALAALDDALDHQRGAIADWRFSLATLQHSVDGLGGSLDAYHHSLGALGRHLRPHAE
jgi:hypothetical protein